MILGEKKLSPLQLQHLAATSLGLQAVLPAWRKEGEAQERSSWRPLLGIADSKPQQEKACPAGEDHDNLQERAPYKPGAACRGRAQGRQTAGVEQADASPRREGSNIRRRHLGWRCRRRVRWGGIEKGKWVVERNGMGVERSNFFKGWRGERGARFGWGGQWVESTEKIHFPLNFCGRLGWHGHVCSPCTFTGPHAFFDQTHCRAETQLRFVTLICSSTKCINCQRPPPPPTTQNGPSQEDHPPCPGEHLPRPPGPRG